MLSSEIYKLMENPLTRDRKIIPVHSSRLNFRGSPWVEVFAGTLTECQEEMGKSQKTNQYENPN
jgi:hypothetical protein